MALMHLLHNCLLSEADVSSILLNELQPRVTEELLNLVVFSFTADPNQYTGNKVSKDQSDLLKISSISTLLEFLRRRNSFTDWKVNDPCRSESRGRATICKMPPKFIQYYSFLFCALSTL